MRLTALLGAALSISPPVVLGHTTPLSCHSEPRRRERQASHSLCASRTSRSAGESGSLRRDRFVFNSVNARPPKVSPQFFSTLTTPLSKSTSIQRSPRASPLRKPSISMSLRETRMEPSTPSPSSASRNTWICAPSRYAGVSISPTRGFVASRQGLPQGRRF
jgi:hypothetical protein